jgi:aminomethyltransferase
LTDLDGSEATGDELLTLALDGLHRELGGRMVPFAGHLMPVQYAAGVMKEHLHTRAAAGLFDVSHMGQVILRPHAGTGMERLGRAFEAMMPVDVLGLPEGRQRYGLFTNDRGGILDDLMFANRGDHLFVVVNAACKAADVARMRAALGEVAGVEVVEDRARLALQGPQAEAALSRIVPGVAALRFMDVATLRSDYGDLWVARSGYTGEDGFEVSVPQAGAEAMARALLAMAEVAPIGLGARDSLRLEAGLPLYGHDIDERTSPVMAGLSWAIQKVRRAGGARAGGFPGSETILKDLAEGPAAIRVGLRPEGRAPMREGTVLWDAPEGGRNIGGVTSGGFGPSVDGPIAMGYVPAGTTGTLWGEVRGRRLPAAIVPLPFHPTSYKR